MKLITALAALSSFSGLVADAQTIQPSSVPLSTRQQWCMAQKQQCPLLCTQINSGSAATTSNYCYADTLQYGCVCANGQSPNSTEYSNTLPFFECQTFNNQCAQACGGTPACQANCFQAHPCGASDPRRYNITTTSSTMTSTATGAAKTGSGSSSQSINGNAGGGKGGNDTGAASIVSIELSRVLTVSLAGAIFCGAVWLL